LKLRDFFTYLALIWGDTEIKNLNAEAMERILQDVGVMARIKAKDGDPIIHELEVYLVGHLDDWAKLDKRLAKLRELAHKRLHSKEKAGCGATCKYHNDEHPGSHGCYHPDKPHPMPCHEQNCPLVALEGLPYAGCSEHAFKGKGS